MRIVLLYPPPWKIPGPGEPLPPRGEGPPSDFEQGDLDADFYQTPYGLFTLGAQAIRAGHQVKVLNLSGFTWTQVEKVIAALEADLWGMSCWTANRRGVGLVAREIRRRYPRAHIVVGGPHATPLAIEMLEHHPEIDTVVLGEGEPTFLELIERLDRGEDPAGIAGTAYRAGIRVCLAPERGSVRDLDALAPPQDYFDTHILMTSRGCPWACTFCGAETTWGRGFRGNSVPYVLDALEKALSRLPVKMVQIKDDTFTTHRKRVLDLCRGMRARGLRFVWSCDTRVDVLSDELLYEMRLAGCQRLSLGVESGSPSVLANIDKKITPDEIIRSTEIAKKYGILVRYYMIVGARGETRKTFEQTLEFLRAARPHQYLFSTLSIYPGTRDFHDAERAGWLSREDYFSGDFQELRTPFDASEEDAAYFAAWFRDNRGLRTMYRESTDDYRAILARLGDHHAAHLDLGAALYREGALDEAEHHVRRAIELGYPLPGIAYNYLACIAYARGDYDAMQDRFTEGVEIDPQHPSLLQNVMATFEWLQQGGPARGLPLALQAQHDFQLLERTIQPTLPGPLPADFAVWKPAETPRPIPPIRPEELAAARRQRRQLAVLARDRG